jgi:hypothetical protein
MATFGTASFGVLLAGDGRLPALERDGGVTITPVPYAGADHVQFRKPGSPRLRLQISVESDWEWDALSSYLGDGVPKTLGDWNGLGTNLPGMVLAELRGRRLAWMADWEAEATFIQVASS